MKPTSTGWFLAGVLVICFARLSVAGLVSHYKLNGDGVDAKAVQDGVLNGVPSLPATVPGKIGTALSFNGTNNVTIVDPAGGQHRPTSITVSAWFNTTENTGDFRGIVDKMEAIVGFSMEKTEPENLVRWYTGDDGSGAPVLKGPLGINDGTWHLVTGTFLPDGGPSGSGALGLYFDGLAYAPIASNYLPMTTTMAIGGDNISTLRFRGMLDDVGLWDRVLSTGEATALYSLANSTALNYDLGAADRLFQLHLAGSGSTVVGGKTWFYAAGLGGSLGDVVDLGGGHYELMLDPSGTGVVSVSVKPGDFDGDGDVDGADFVAWQTNFPKASGALLTEGDADGDGDVDGADFVVWQTNFPFPPGPGVAPFPEPHALILFTLGGLTIWMYRRNFARSSAT